MRQKLPSSPGHFFVRAVVESTFSSVVDKLEEAQVTGLCRDLVVSNWTDKTSEMLRDEEQEPLLLLRHDGDI